MGAETGLEALVPGHDPIYGSDTSLGRRWVQCPCGFTCDVADEPAGERVKLTHVVESVRADERERAQAIVAAAEAFLVAWRRGEDETSAVDEAEDLDEALSEWRVCGAPSNALQGAAQPCRHYEIERFDSDSDHPDWHPTGEIYRTKEAAEHYVAEQDARLLQYKNDRTRRGHHERIAAYKEHVALVEAGLRSSRGGSTGPAAFVPITEFGRWEERYRGVLVEFEEGAR